MKNQFYKFITGSHIDLSRVVEISALMGSKAHRERYPEDSFENRFTAFNIRYTLLDKPVLIQCFTNDSNRLKIKNDFEADYNKLVAAWQEYRSWTEGGKVDEQQLRDQLAMSALTGLLVSSKIMTSDLLSERAYIIADKMLKARKTT